MIEMIDDHAEYTLAMPLMTVRLTPVSALQRVATTAAICLLLSLTGVGGWRFLGGDAERLLAQSASQLVTYIPSAENFPNPERGFYRQRLPFGLGNERYPLDSGALASFRAEGITLIRAYYVIDEFRITRLPAAALDAIGSDFLAVRQAGLKIIPRFAYNFPGLADFRAAQDAPLERVLAHLAQLEPTLRAYGDVIAFFEMGFVGAWGEWHNSSNRLVNRDLTPNASSAAIVERILAALPATRAAALRYPFHKQELFGPLPLDLSSAFTGEPRARVGAHNDCFASNESNGGTYSALRTRPQTIAEFKQYLHLDNRFVPQGGEACGTDVAANAMSLPFIHCDASLQDLALMRWSTMNVEYNREVLELWLQEGCFGEVQLKLGYRFRLVEADLPREVRRGTAASFRLLLVNDGWASPYNPRLAQLLLRHTGTSQIYTIPLSADPRLWTRGAHTVMVDHQIPRELETGTYEMLIEFPDPEHGLFRRAEYSIRLANPGVWEAATGFNSLKARVTIR